MLCETEHIRESFFCESVEGAELDATTVMTGDFFCPLPGTTARASLAAMNPCQDVIFECRDPSDAEFASCASLPPDASDCPVGYQRGRETSGCSNENDQLAAEKVVVACSHLGTRAPPSGDRPARYCYTACVDNQTVEYEADPHSCEASLFDPPEVTAGSYDWLLADSGSTVTIAVGTDLSRFPVEGRVAFHAPRCLPGDTCGAELSFVRATVPHAFTLAGQTFDHVIFQNPVPIRGGRVTPVSSTESSIELPAGAQMFGSADTTLSSDRLGGTLTSSVPITGSIRWDVRLVTIDAVFVESMTETVVTLHIVGRIPNRAPLAFAGVDRIIECTSATGAPVALSGVGSYDPDDPQGAQIPLYYNWSSEPGNARAPVTARGRMTTVQQPIGEMAYDLTVSDPMASATTDSVVVRVVDRVGATFDGSQLPVCVPPDGRMRLFVASDYARAFVDTCDPSLDFRVVGVASSQVDRGLRTPDTRVGVAGNFCVRGELEPLSVGSRNYSVTVEAIDASGNVRSVVLPVVVPSGACAGAVWTVPVVADGDPRCGSSSSDAGPAPDAGGGGTPGCQSCSLPARSRGHGPGAAVVAALALVFALRLRRGRGQ